MIPSEKTAIQMLFDLDFVTDDKIARRLQVTRATIVRWRAGRHKPGKSYQKVAIAYLSELHAQLSNALASAALNLAA
jgi:hypothetical protein